MEKNKFLHGKIANIVHLTKFLEDLSSISKGRLDLTSKLET